jgi:hypothetical protein
MAALHCLRAEVGIELSRRYDQCERSGIMIDQQITAAFTAALSKWVTAAALHLDQERMELFGVSLKADDMDLRVVVRLRESIA